MSNRAFIHRPFDGHIVMKPTGILLVRRHGTDGFINAGNYESVEYTMNQEEEDVWSPQTPERSKVATIFGEQSIDLNFGLRQAPDLFRTIAAQSDPDLKLEQPAVEAAVFVIPNARAGCIYKLPHRGIVDWAATAGAQDLVNETNVQMDEELGHFEVIAFPGDQETGSVTITYDAAAIEGRRQMGFFSAADLRFEVMFRGVSRYGPVQLTEFWDAQLRADGAQTLGANSNEQAVTNYVGKVFAAANQNAAYQYGRVTDIPRRLAA